MHWPEDLESVDEIDMETSAGDVASRTTIWCVVDNGTVYVRSLRGRAGRWYQRLTANPDAVMHVRGESVPVRAVSAPDPESVAQATAGYRRKYADSPFLASMMRDEILDTTTRLETR
jgi:hypothetical protein